MTADLDPDCPYIATIEDALTPTECTGLIQRIDALGPKVAPISTASGPRVNLDIRNDERVMFEDKALAAVAFERVRNQVPAKVHGMSLVGANELFRCYRYQVGMRFAPHSDGFFRRDGTEQSKYSLLLYLNDDFEGGSTRFLVEPEVSIQPKRGMALLFQHLIIHEGAMVTTGTKYVARSDLMYRSG